MSNRQSTLLVGLPGTGKTSYLAILFLAIVEERACSVRLADFEDDRAYVNKIAQAMVQCREAKRTEVSATSGLGIAIKLPDGTNATLQIPDVSGETWHAALEERTIDESLAESIVTATSICIFVHVGEFSNDPSISELNAVTAALGTDDVETDAADDSDVHTDSTQVQVVDLLQVIAQTRETNPGRLSLILSAFDTVDEQTPAQWIEMNAPLLHQYLTVNRVALDVDIYGLSAQGGEFSNEIASELLMNRNPVDRAFMVGFDGSRVDFDAPIFRLIAHD